MITIKLVDARRMLNIKCRELFKDEKIAESIYRYLCDGIEECDDVEPERKGMEMPPNCFLCPLSVLNGERLFCEVTKEEVIRAKRSSCCPLVPVPPHGRLIDADLALRSAKPSNVTDDQWSQTTLARCIINAPTIIPAEEGET